MDDQTRLDDNMANYADLILAGRDPAPSEELESQARIMQVLNEAIKPGQSMDAGMRSRLNHRINEEWDSAQQRRKSRFQILSFNNFNLMAVAASLAIVVAVVAIVIGMGDSSGSSMGATAQGDGDSGDLAIFGAIAVVIIVSGFLYFLWNRRR